ncbi:Zinc-type alcohol dehydrogenase-like protein [Cladobotryum mycophilum]|uniref:Zinc-type alcohol dehydrogenase-like protein n=1 Tax=Cladobotryum mycophilum TaxID=491253 RepID=A0ABR0SCK0_9HYPO
MVVVPETTKKWTVTGFSGFDALKLVEEALPTLGDSQVLVKLEAATLNYRDLIITHGKYPLAIKDNVVPGSDGAGTVLAIGKQVTRFQPGDKVITLFNQEHIGGPLNASNAITGLGGQIDGVLRTVGAFNEQGLVRKPDSLTSLEAATLPCAGLTAWNAIFGSVDHIAKPGHWILTQGTGGVSIFALQFAKSAGAKVIATTGSKEKVDYLKKLGADYVLNYKEDLTWGETAKKITGGVGVDNVVQVAGSKEMEQSIASVKIGGIINIIGFMEDMLAAIEANPERLRPVVDQKVFTLEEAREAYEYQWSGKHFAKVGIEIA